MDPVDTVPWSDLPKELWAAIGRRLDFHMDVLRFRSVCSTWRFLLPPSFPSATRLPLSVPPLSDSISIFQSTIYRLHPSLDDPSSSSSSSPGWLVKIAHQSVLEESDPKSESGLTMQLLNPLTDCQIKFKSGTFPNLLNLLNFRVTEVCKEYKLRHAAGNPVLEVQKVLLSPNSPWTNVEEIIIVAIWLGKLRIWKYGSESWTEIGGEGLPRFDDIIHYKGQFYAVDEWGTVSWIDSAMRVVQFSPPMIGGGDRKHLVEFNGDLYVVDQYMLMEVNKYYYILVESGYIKKGIIFKDHCILKTIIHNYF